MIHKLWFTTIALGIVAATFHSTTRLQLSFTIHDVQVGDPNVSYANVEFTADGRYMVWFEQTPDGTGRGTVWHCAIDPETAEFMPPDCKGFRAFGAELKYGPCCSRIHCQWRDANAQSDAVDVVVLRRCRAYP